MNKFNLTNEIFGLRLCIVLTAVVLCFGMACNSNRPEDQYVSIPESDIKVEDVVQDPGRYIGKQVTVAGKIEEMFGEQAFMIHGEKMVDGLLALGTDPFPEAQNENLIITYA
ncbi:MAG TPA: hypothetical protein VF556_01180 [Pyrinomonadaceae bacterium]|jgi:hypothetical protein